ncbi:sugar-binding protein [Sorangium sp. So ce1036]|uniref:sugar-binding protein n=1 Tax=Sorangium sp. So ce1036 TaxID=3133328 RepID=UPI003F0504C3
MPTPGRPSGRAGRALTALAIGLAATSAVGCSLVSSFDGLTGGASCDREAYVDTCEVIPRAPDGFRHVIDGDRAELCAVESDPFDPLKGVYRSKPDGEPSCPPPSWLVEAAPHVVLRAAWSDEALHVHVRVDKATEIVLGEGEALYDGDAVEIFVGNAEAPTGVLEEDHATYLTFAPPLVPGGEGRSHSGKIAGVSSRARRDHAGYEVEIAIPWASLGGEPPSPGRRILWNVALDVAAEIEPGGERERFQSFLHYKDHAGDGKQRFCRYDDPLHDERKPSRDDRSWCTPVLSP